MAGRIELITGPMFAGKTERLLMLRDAYEHLGYGTFPILIPEVFQTKDKSKGIKQKTHNGRLYEAFPTKSLSEELAWFRDAVSGENHAFFIDEVQFFPPEVVRVIERTARKWGWTVICAGLLLDFRHLAWETTCQIYSIADSVTDLRARCAVCGELANHTQRLHLDGTPARADEPRVVLSGDGVRYEPRCWRCHVVADAGK